MSVSINPSVSLRSKTENIVAQNRKREKIAFGVLRSVLCLVVLGVFALLGFIFVRGIGKLNWAFLSTSSNADASGGIFPQLLGTYYLIVGTILIALPLGIAGAIYLSEYAGHSPLVRLIRLAIVNLAGVPSIVHGLFGLGFFVLFVGGSIDRFILHTQTPVWGQPCMLWGFCTLAVVILPLIITATEEALLSVPRSFREASLGMGATKWQTIWNVVLPTALPGILTGAILGIGRAAGETAPVMLTCAASFKPTLPVAYNDQTLLLPYHLYYVVTQVPNSTTETQSGIAMVLILMVFSINIIAVIVRTKMRRARKW